MKNPYDSGWDDLRQKVLGFGDTSARKSHYLSLRQRLADLERFRSLIDVSSDLLFLLEISSGKIVDVNESVCRRVGRSRELVLKSSFREFVTPSTFAEILALGNDFTAGSRDSAVIRAELSGQEEQGFPVELAVRIVHSRGGNYAVVAARDITERIRAEQALSQSEQRFRALIESSSDWVWEVDERAIYTYASPKIRDILGYEPDDVVGKSPFDLMPEQEARRIAAAFFQFVSARAPFAGLENTNIHKDGRQIVLETSGVPFFDEAGEFRGYRGIDRDITERKRLEERLRQAQKMEAIGQLSGGVAHDFNNLLTVILGNSEIVLQTISSGDPRRSRIEEIQSSAERAAALTKQLLAFSRRQVLQPRVLDLNLLVRDMGKMLTRLVGEQIELKTSLDRELRRVSADPGQIELVIMNLVVNARDAMPGGGSIVIETSNLDSPAQSPESARGLGHGPYVLMSVKDSGYGMDADTKSRIFEPFFTTKEIGKGTGLGLSTVYGIVEQSGGRIWVESSPGQGATFTVCLPAVEQPAEPQAVEKHEAGTGGRETILVVEDEEGVRGLIRLTLEQLGYNTLLSNDGRQALEKCEEYPGPIHLLLTDVIMPKMGGMELAKHVSMLRPGIKVLYLSGYSMDVSVVEGEFLQKPFRPDELGRKVRDTLDSAASGTIATDVA